MKMRVLTFAMLVIFSVGAPAQNASSLHDGQVEVIDDEDGVVISRDVSAFDFGSAITFFVTSKVITATFGLHFCAPQSWEKIIAHIGAGAAGTLVITALMRDILTAVNVSHDGASVVDGILLAGFTSLLSGICLVPILGTRAHCIAPIAGMYGLSYLLHAVGFGIYVAVYTGVL